MNFRTQLAGMQEQPLGDEAVLLAISAAANVAHQSAPPPESKTKGPAPYPWILHPVIDLLFTCGGFFWIASFIYMGLGLHLDLKTALICNILGNVLFTDMHQPATLFRVYGCARTRKQVGTTVALWGVFVLILGAGALSSGAFTSLLLRITVAWSLQHLLAQTYGIALIYCYKRQYIMTDREKQSLSLLIQTTLGFLIIRMFSTPTNVPMFGVPMADCGRLPEWMLFVAGLVVQCAALNFVFMVVRKWIKERKMFPLPAIFTLLTNLIIVLTFYQNPIIAIFVQNFYHSAQYNVVTTAYFFKQKGLPEGVPFSKIASQLLTPRYFKYFGFLLLLGLLLSVALPCTFEMIGFAYTGAIAYCVLNLHHYFSDAMIWRMRDPVVRKLLVA